MPTHLSVTQNPDPEQILSLDPDLVLLTGRHDDEASLIDSLEGVGVPIAAFESTDFGDPGDRRELESRPLAISSALTLKRARSRAQSVTTPRQ